MVPIGKQACHSLLLVFFLLVGALSPAASAEELSSNELPRILGCDWGAINAGADKVNLITLKHAGLDYLLLGVNAGWSGAQRRFLEKRVKGIPVPNICFWDGKDKYNPAEIRDLLQVTKQQHPQAKIILWLQIDTYPEWIQENPTEAVRNDKGDGFVVNFHFQRVGNDPNPAKREVLAWSFYSKRLREDLAKMLSQFVKTVESSPGGEQVVGYLIGGAQDAQLYLWEAPNSAKSKDPAIWSDYSSPAVAAWHEWLRKKYVDPKTLSQEWNEPVSSFEDAAPPKAETLIGKEGYHDPLKERRQMDWKHFIADGRIDFAEDIADMIRNASSRKLLIGTSSGDNGARANMTANVRLMRSNKLDFVNAPVRYDLRLPPNSVGGALTVYDSFRLNNKPILFDLDYRTWKNTNYGNNTISPAYTISSRMVGRASTPQELGNAWLREAGRIVIGGHRCFLDPVEGAMTHEDPLIQLEMNALQKNLIGAAALPGESTGAEVAVIYDERSADFLKGALGSLHYFWSSAQRAELDLSGVPYGYYYVEDFKAGKVPPAKLYIFLNLWDIDSQLETSISKIRKDNAVLCFMQGTGYNLQKKDLKLLSKIIGMTVVPASAASSIKTDNKVVSQPLLPLQAAPSLNLPVEWTAFGPFPIKDPAFPAKDLVSMPEKIEVAGKVYPAQRITRDGGMLDFGKLYGRYGDGQSAYAFCQIDSDDAKEVLVGAGADWWMTWFLNGEQVFDNSAFGNEFAMVNSDNYAIPLKLKKGKNTLAVKVVSGSRAFILGVEERTAVQSGIIQARMDGLVLDPQLGLLVNDPQARELACYPQTTLCGAAERTVADSRSIFFGSFCLRRGTVRALAEYAGAWRLTPTNYAIAANKRAVMIHPLVDGAVTVSLREPAALVEVNGKIPSQSWAKEHRLDLKAYETYLFQITGQETLAGIGGGAQKIKKDTMVSYGFLLDSNAPDAIQKISPSASSPELNATYLGMGTGIQAKTIGISGIGKPGPSLFINGKSLNVKSEQDARKGENYLSFTITPKSGSQIAVSGFSFDLDRGDNNAVTSFSLYADNAGKFELVASGQLSKLSGNSNEDFITYKTDLSKTEFLQSITKPTTFKLYFYGSSYEDKTPGNVRLDNITVFGTPRPAKR